MRFLRKLHTRTNKNGHLESWGVFECPVCLQEIEMRLSNGYKCKSCGCNKNIKHGEIKTRLYNIWAMIKQRVLNLNHTAYKDYGGRGITICNEWLEFIPFRDWSLANGYQEGLEIDRRGNYEPNNCRFVPHVKNCQNRSSTKLSQEKANEIRGLHNTGNYTQQELAKIYGVPNSNISRIINNKIWKG